MIAHRSGEENALPAYFTKDTFQFLNQLRRNNNKAWFDDNRERYHEQVRDPFLKLIKDFNPRLATVSEHYHGVEKAHGGALFRIYRDTRFSKDKTPYKSWAGARFTHREAGRNGAPIYYLHVQPGNVFFAAGLWRPPGPMINQIRTFLHNNPGAWTKLRDNKTFKRTFSWGGEQLKRTPRGYDADHPLADDLRRKDFVVSASLSEAQAISSSFLTVLQRRCEQSASLMDYLCASLDLEF
ncbi:MAG: TIGR02453 family protein [Pseudomonadota bacterium]